ncbi:MAG TPA: hypothetical protein PKL57_21020, partial [Candidatus Wallbacteria bacterium]|nr:hypothetical protein [Candidatus Wallbacteria bacterium]
ETDNVEFLPNIYFSIVQTDHANKWHKILSKMATGNTTTPVELTDLILDDDKPRIDRDGKYIVFERKYTEKSEICYMESSGENAIILSRQTYDTKTMSSGDKIKYTGKVKASASGGCYQYYIFSTKEVAFTKDQAGLYIEYDYYSDTTGAGIGGLNVMYETTEASFGVSGKFELRNDPAWAATDKPTSDFVGGNNNKWLHRKIEIPSTLMLNEVSIKTWEVTFENSTPSKQITAYYDNICITNSDGRIETRIYSKGPLEYTKASEYYKDYENYSVSIEKPRIDNEEINTKMTRDKSPDISANGRKVVFSSYTGNKRYRLKITKAPAGYTVKTTITGDMAKGIVDNSMDNGDDFRIFWKYYDSAESKTKEIELDRYLESFTSDDITAWFKIQESAGWDGGLSNYYIEYGRNRAGS